MKRQLVTRFYHRSGERLSRKRAYEIKRAAADNYRYGRPPIQHINVGVANRIDSMSIEEFASYSGAFTYRREVRP